MKNLKSKGLKSQYSSGFSVKKRVKKVSKAQIDFWIASSQKAQKTF